MQRLSSRIHVNPAIAAAHVIGLSTACVEARRAICGAPSFSRM
jgi:hypothetical protein